ncbi:MAG: lysophospholipid acyltransferase family protein [Planctomycetota bacterium]
MSRIEADASSFTLDVRARERGVSGKPSWVHHVSATAGAYLVRGLFETCQSKVQGFREHVEPRQERGLPTLVAFWHCNILLLTGNFTGYTARVLISEHSDGEHIAGVIRRLGMCVVRGSSTRGGGRALVRLLREMKEGHDVVVTPDGPKGPPRVVAPGIIFLAARTGAPISPVGAWADRMHCFGSWDSFRCPKPMARISVRYGAPLHIPPEAADHPAPWQARLAERMEEEEGLCRADMRSGYDGVPFGSWSRVRSEQ